LRFGGTIPTYKHRVTAERIGLAVDSAPGLTTFIPNLDKRLRSAQHMDVLGNAGGLAAFGLPDAGFLERDLMLIVDA